MLWILIGLICGSGASGQTCSGYSYWTDTWGVRHYYLSTDPSETDLGSTCPAGGATTTRTGSTTGTLTSSPGGYAVQMSVVSSFGATGGKAGNGTVTVTNPSTGVAKAGVWVSITVNEWTYQSGDQQTDASGQVRIYWGHVRPALVTITAYASDFEGQRNGGSASAQSQGYESASGSNSFTFYAPAAGQHYRCVPGSVSDDYIGFTFGWYTYKYSPLGWLVTVSGPSGSGVYWSQDEPASGQGTTSFDSCRWAASISNTTGSAYGTLWVRYYTLNGQQYYAVASKQSNSFTVSY